MARPRGRHDRRPHRAAGRGERLQLVLRIGVVRLGLCVQLGVEGGASLREQSRDTTSEDNQALEKFPQTLDAALDALGSDEAFHGVKQAVRKVL